MSVEEKIKKLVETNDRSLSWLAKQVGMSRPGFNTMLETGSIRVDILQKIAEVFKVPIDYFFSDKIEELEKDLKFERFNRKSAPLADLALYEPLFDQIKEILKYEKSNSPFSREQIISLLEVIISISDGWRKSAYERLNSELTDEERTYIELVFGRLNDKIKQLALSISKS